MSILKNLLGNLMGVNHQMGGGGGHHGGSKGYSKHGYSSYTQTEQAPPSVSNVMCPQCNQPNSSGARFCQGCGNSLLPTNCSGCQSTLPAGTRFCGQCGKSVK
jgi:membrane protease subunit (stomatin/prohibitin family)